MSDTRGAPDFLDRLIARHAGPRPAAARVRPRLPGPFERVEAVRAAAPTPDEDTLLWPAATPSAAPPAEAVRPTAAPVPRTHTERERTVVRTERAAEQQAARPAPALPEAPLLRPAAPVAPPRVLPETGRRAAGRGRAEGAPSQTAAAMPIPPGTDAAPTVVSAALRPSAADTTAARDAVRQAVARRPGRPTEQVVQVQIGRLEVMAGDASADSGRRRTPAKERAGAALSLADYLARGRE